MLNYQYFVANKPFDVLCAFTSEPGQRNLRELGKIPTDVYPVGRLDKDSEGLLVLTNDPRVNAKLLQPKQEKRKYYYAQVEGTATKNEIDQLLTGVIINIKGKSYKVKANEASIVEEPEWIWPRNPPIRERKNIPTSWIRISISEGKNRQIRRMTAAVGLPTLRLVRHAIEGLSLSFLEDGTLKEIDYPTFRKLLLI